MMDQNINQTLFYHQTTKHAPGRYAKSLGYMDWSTQPNPFRLYESTQKTVLPLPQVLEQVTMATLGNAPIQPLTLATISRFLGFALGLAAWKGYGSDVWAVRCNASSGNLHPTEGYVFLPPIDDHEAMLAHYDVYGHALEMLSPIERSFWDGLPEGTFLVGLGSILWREAWKYGERSFRYTQLDLGHAFWAMKLSAQVLGWHVSVIEIPDDALIDRLLGFDQPSRAHKYEQPFGNLMLTVSPQKSLSVDLELLLNALTSPYAGTPNRLSPSHHPWELLPRITHATRTLLKQHAWDVTLGILPATGRSAHEILLARRSVQGMDPTRLPLDYASFLALLTSVHTSQATSVHLVLFVHAVAGLKAGTYIMIRDANALDALKNAMHDTFAWTPIESHLGLFLLAEADTRAIAHAFSCGQTIASQGAFSLGMLVRFQDEIQTHGAKRYKELFWECGALGQQLYVAATTLGLSGTGIGCFLDDVVHAHVGVRDTLWQFLYHFTVGFGLEDTRLGTHGAYEHRDN